MPNKSLQPDAGRHVAAIKDLDQEEDQGADQEHDQDRAETVHHVVGNGLLGFWGCFSRAPPPAHLDNNGLRSGECGVAIKYRKFAASSPFGI